LNVASERPYFERVTETVRTASPAALSRREACLVHIYPSGPTMGRRYALTGVPVVIGRGTDCGIQIEDNSVSRRHARLVCAEEGFVASDLESTNGTYVNNVPVARQVLRDGDYLRVGNCIYRFLAGGNVEAEYHEEIYRLAIVDGLTEIANKRYLLEFLNRELARAERYERPLTLILLDIDRFKAVNDERGHLCGDSVLRELALRLKPVVRAEELLARYGGEEFAVVLPEATSEQAVVVAERLRQLVADAPFTFDGQTFGLTISLGVATASGKETTAPETLIHRADEKLYEAKHGGRNRVVA
jgi:diguanylate cyclase (GGDEF)-like protein